MGLVTWIREKMKDGKMNYTTIDNTQFFDLLADSYVRELAINAAIGIIAKSVSKCEFQTYVKGVETKGAEYYLFNIEPNYNQNSSQFINKWIYKLYTENECLIIEQDGQLFVADGFQVEERAFYDNVFSGVTVGNLILNKKYYMNEVLYYKLAETNIRNVIAGLYESYGKLIEYGMKSYKKSHGSRGILNIETSARGDKDYQKNLDELLNNRFRTFFNAENAVLPLHNGFNYEELNKQGQKQRADEGTRDIRATIDDVFDFTAKGFGVPPALMRGDVVGIGEVVDQYLTFTMDPLCNMLQEEINRKRNGFKGFLDNTFTKINTKAIKHVDLLSVSTAVDKLISSGAFCINDIRELVGDEPINEPWASQHFMTKNYDTVNNLLLALNERREDA